MDRFLKNENLLSKVPLKMRTDKATGLEQNDLGCNFLRKKYRRYEMKRRDATASNATVVITLEHGCSITGARLPVQYRTMFKKSICAEPSCNRY